MMLPLKKVLLNGVHEGSWSECARYPRTWVRPVLYGCLWEKQNVFSSTVVPDYMDSSYQLMSELKDGTVCESKMINGTQQLEGLSLSGFDYWLQDISNIQLN